AARRPARHPHGTRRLARHPRPAATPAAPGYHPKNGAGGSGMATTYKQEVVASRSVVASNHPPASAAGVEMLVRGGNAVDAAVATLFALTVVEPMMVSIAGAGFFVIRDGKTGNVVTLDNYATCPAAATETMYTPVPDPVEWLAEGDENRTGHKAVGVLGALKGWAEALSRFGRLSLAEVMTPAIRYAAD